MAYGYKPSDLMQMRAIDVVDFFKGLRARLKGEYKLLFDAAEMAGMLATGQYRRKSGEIERTNYSPKIRDMIAEADERDRKLGLING